MYYVTDTEGRLLWCADEGLRPDDATTTPLDGSSVSEQKWMDVSRQKFEAEARVDAGLSEGERLGDVYIEDEPPAGSQAFGSTGKPGRRVGQKRVRAYAPANPVTELREELGKNERQSVSWDDLQSIYERLMK